MGFEEFVQKVNPSLMIGKTQQYKLQGPDGVIHTIEGPVGASERQVQEAIVYQLNQREKNLQQTPETPSPKLPPCKFAKIGMACIKMPLSLPPCDMVLEGQNCLKMP